MNDGDKSLVCADETIIEAAKRNCVGIVPLYYIMAKAPAQELNAQNMYDGMIAAYTGGNIGEISNSITKIWNSHKPKTELVKLLCALNNYTIDYAKTLYKPAFPESVQHMIQDATNGKVPHFFLYAKDKKENQVERRNSSCVNRLYDIIELHKFNFNKKQLGTFDYKMLMRNPLLSMGESDQNLVQKYYELANSVNCRIIDDDGKNNYDLVFQEIKDELLKIDPDIYHLTDVLITQLFKIKKSKHKVVFWNCFGDVVLENLNQNINENTIMCERCGKRFRPTAEQQKYCSDCVGYQPIETKIITCVDCGGEFEVDGIVKNKNRCPECYKKYRKKIINDNAKRYYQSKNN